MCSLFEKGLTCPSTPCTGAIVKAWLQEIDFVRDLRKGYLNWTNGSRWAIERLNDFRLGMRRLYEDIAIGDDM